MDKRVKIIISIFLVVLAISMFYIITKAITKYTGHAVKGSGLDNFAKCLNEKGIVVYSSEKYVNCQGQELLFGSSWQYMNVTDCDIEENAEKAGCLAVEIIKNPTWVVEGRYTNGVKSIELLSNQSGCEL